MTTLIQLMQSALELADMSDSDKADVAMIVAGRYLNKDFTPKKDSQARLAKWMNKSICDPLNIKV